MEENNTLDPQYVQELINILTAQRNEATDKAVMLQAQLSLITKKYNDLLAENKDKDD